MEYIKKIWIDQSQCWQVKAVMRILSEPLKRRKEENKS